MRSRSSSALRRALELARPLGLREALPAAAYSFGAGQRHKQPGGDRQRRQHLRSAGVPKRPRQSKKDQPASSDRGPRDHPLPGEHRRDNREAKGQEVRTERIAPRDVRPPSRRTRTQAPRARTAAAGRARADRARAARRHRRQAASLGDTQTPTSSCACATRDAPPPPWRRSGSPRTSRRDGRRCGGSSPTRSQPHDSPARGGRHRLAGAAADTPAGVHGAAAVRRREQHRSRPSPDDKSPAGEHASPCSTRPNHTDRRSNDVRVRHDQPDDPEPQPARERRRPRRDRRPAAPAPHRRPARPGRIPGAPGKVLRREDRGRACRAHARPAGRSGPAPARAAAPASACSAACA